MGGNTPSIYVFLSISNFLYLLSPPFSVQQAAPRCHRTSWAKDKLEAVIEKQLSREHRPIYQPFKEITENRLFVA